MTTVKFMKRNEKPVILTRDGVSRIHVVVAPKSGYSLSGKLVKAFEADLIGVGYVPVWGRMGH